MGKSLWRFENDQNIFFTDPLFIDLYGNDYHLSDYSPALGMGAVVDSLPYYDLDGLARISPEGSNPDLGCYENPFIMPELVH